MDVLIPFALDPETGSFVDVEEVARGRGCGCICPSCKTPLIARHGEVKVWHFAHAARAVYEQTEDRCEYSFWVSVRLMARQLLAEQGTLTLRLPGLRNVASLYSPVLGRWFEEPYEVTAPSTVQLEEVQIECQLSDGIVVDVIGKVKGVRLAIYLTHPDRDAPTASLWPQGDRMGAIAIALDDLEPVFERHRRTRASYREELARHLCESTAAKRWLSHPRDAARRVVVDAKLETAMRAAELEGPDRKPRQSEPRRNRGYRRDRPPPADRAIRWGNYRCCICGERWQSPLYRLQDCPQGHEWLLATCESEFDRT